MPSHAKRPCSLLSHKLISKVNASSSSISLSRPIQLLRSPAHEKPQPSHPRDPSTSITAPHSICYLWQVQGPSISGGSRASHARYIYMPFSSDEEPTNSRTGTFCAKMRMQPGTDRYTDKVMEICYLGLWGRVCEKST